MHVLRTRKKKAALNCFRCPPSRSSSSLALAANFLFVNGKAPIRTSHKGDKGRGNNREWGRMIEGKGREGRGEETPREHNCQRFIPSDNQDRALYSAPSSSLASFAMGASSRRRAATRARESEGCTCRIIGKPQDTSFKTRDVRVSPERPRAAVGWARRRGLW